MALRPTDPALLHYRSGGFYVARARRSPARPGPGRAAGADRLPRRADRRRAAQGVRASAIWRHPADLHGRLPSAAGGRAGRRAAPRAAARRGTRVAEDAVVVAASATPRSTTRPRSGRSTPPGAPSPRLPVPCCSSARTTAGASRCPPRPAGSSARVGSGRVSTTCGRRRGPATRWPLDEAAATASARARDPAFLHLRTVRFLGHAGADAEIALPARARDDRRPARDPLLGTAQALVDAAAGRRRTCWRATTDRGEIARRGRRRLTGGRGSPRPSRGDGAARPRAARTGRGQPPRASERHNPPPANRRPWPSPSTQPWTECCPPTGG